MKQPPSSDTSNITEDIFLSENIVLLNDLRVPIGSAPKLASHHSDTPLHLAFSIYIFDTENNFLVTKRASIKKVWPGVWTNSCCGHPMPGESMEDAITRRAKFELGLTIHDISELIHDYQYKTPPYNGIIENEYCPVYTARTKSPVMPNSDEVDDYKWLEWNQYVELVESDTNNVWSWWCKDQLKLIKSTKAIDNYLGI